MDDNILLARHCDWYSSGSSVAGFSCSPSVKHSLSLQLHLVSDRVPTCDLYTVRGVLCGTSLAVAPWQDKHQERSSTDQIVKTAIGALFAIGIALVLWYLIMRLHEISYSTRIRSDTFVRKMEGIVIQAALVIIAIWDFETLVDLTTAAIEGRQYQVQNTSYLPGMLDSLFRGAIGSAVVVIFAMVAERLTRAHSRATRS